MTIDQIDQNLNSNKIKGGNGNMKTIDELAQAILEQGGDKETIAKIISNSGVVRTAAADRIDWIADSDSITVLHERKNTAAASKSKMKYNRAAVERYDAQIQAIKDKLVELNNLIDAEATWELRIKKAAEFDMEPGALLQKYVIPMLDDRADEVIKRAPKTTQATLKGLIKSCKNIIPQDVTNELAPILDGKVLEALEDRKDTRVDTLLRKLNFAAIMLGLESKK